MELGARLGLQPTEVEEALVDANGDWSQATAVLSQAAAAAREAAADAAAVEGAWHPQPAAPVASTATEDDNYGWGPGLGESVQAAQDEWEAVPPGSEWDTSPRPPGAGAAFRASNSAPEVDSYGWPIEPEQQPAAAHAASHGGGGAAVDDHGWSFEEAPAASASFGFSDARPGQQAGASRQHSSASGGWGGQGEASETAGACGWGEAGTSAEAAAEAAAAAYQPAPAGYAPAPAVSQQPTLQHLPPHMLAQHAAQAAATAQPGLSPHAPEWNPAPAAPPAPPAPAAQLAAVYFAPVVQAPLPPLALGGQPAYQPAY